MLLYENVDVDIDIILHLSWHWSQSLPYMRL